MSDRNDAAPAYLVKTTTTSRGWDGEPSTNHSWYPCETYKEVEELVACTSRPGHGQEYESVTLTTYRIAPVFTEVTELAPLTMAEVALETVTYEAGGAKGVRVDVKLYDTRNTPTVFWDTRGNSFAIVKPADRGNTYVSDQGVALLSINGHGEIRWAIDLSCSNSPENAEAVKHFGLTWLGAMVRHGEIDADEAAVLKRVDWPTVLEARRRGKKALRELILLHAALAGELSA